MTAILVDKYKDTLYIFSDQRETGYDYVVSDSCHKQYRYDFTDRTVVGVFAGNSDITEYALVKYLGFNHYTEYMIWAHETNTAISTLRDNELALEGLIIDYKKDHNHVDLVMVTKDPTQNHMAVYGLTAQELPRFFGCGGKCLNMGYELYHLPEFKQRGDLKEEEYIEFIHDIFKANSVIDTFCNATVSMDTIKLKKKTSLGRL